MPFGAHETMEVHECLMEKINAITHFNLYAKQAQHPQLLDMIVRQQQEEIRSYNEIVDITRGRHGFHPIPPQTEIRGVTHQQIQYGLRNPPQFAPQADAALNDAEIAVAMLLCHKNGARNCAWAALECADPNLRMALHNSSATCTHQAYEVFLWMNQQGLYQVPTLKDQTERNFLQSYQPAEEALHVQYSMQNGQNAGNMVQNATYTGNMMQNTQYAGNTMQDTQHAGNMMQESQYGAAMGTNRGNMYGAAGYSRTNMAEPEASAMNGSMDPSNRQNILYGEASRGRASAYHAGTRSMYDNAQGSMPQ